MKKSNLNLYKSLFRRVNLKEENMIIPDFMQPVAYVVLQTDETLKEILEILNYIGLYIHLEEFKNFLINHTI